MNADGSDQRRLTPTAGDSSPAWSPDGQRIAYAAELGGIGESDIYVANADGSDRRRLTRDAVSRGPRWSPDGRKIAFTRSGVRQEAGATWVSDVYVIDADGSGERSLTGDAVSGVPVWSRTVAGSPSGAVGTIAKGSTS